MTRPASLPFALDFLGEPESTELLRYIEALEQDAVLFRALEWADGMILEGEQGNIDNHWEYAPAGYNGHPVNRYYMGTKSRKFHDSALYALKRMQADQEKEPK